MMIPMQEYQLLLSCNNEKRVDQLGHFAQREQYHPRSFRRRMLQCVQKLNLAPKQHCRANASTHFREGADDQKDFCPQNRFVKILS